MPAFRYKTNGEEVKCVNCGNTEFAKIGAGQNTEDAPPAVAYECLRCHFVSWFGKDFAPEPK